jgi:uncharacterized membrane protein (UPF0182 family)
VFAYFSTRFMPYNLASWLWRGVAALSCIALSIVVSTELARALGLLAGFVLIQDDWALPSNVMWRVLLTIAGLALAIAVYIGSGIVLGELRHVPVVTCLRFAAVTLVATQLWPRILEYFSANPKKISK